MSDRLKKTFFPCAKLSFETHLGRFQERPKYFQNFFGVLQFFSKIIWNFYTVFHKFFQVALMITWPAYCWHDQPSYRSYHLQNSILIYWSYRKDPYCILLLSVMPVDTAQKKKKDEIRLIGSWDLGVLFQKVLPAEHNAGRVIIKNFTELPSNFFFSLFEVFCIFFNVFLKISS